MDNGAHFHKCDFQAHTPRDTNWEGADAVSHDERQQYAHDFVAACRLKGIDAVAITDHHDLAFFKYIRAAAESETDCWELVVQRPAPDGISRDGVNSCGALSGTPDPGC